MTKGVANAIGFKSAVTRMSHWMQARQGLAGLDAVDAAVAGAMAALQRAATSGPPGDQAAQLRTVLHSLQQQQQQGLLGGLLAGGQPAEQMPDWRLLLPPAADLAALMQQYYALPALEAERRLLLAQAAAGRSCAYLHCANLGGEGGPAAGQGAGSMRCRCVDGARGLAMGQLGQLNSLIVLASTAQLSLRSAALPIAARHPCIVLSLCAAPAVRCGTAALAARTPTGGRAGTAACAGRWARRGGRPRRRQQLRQLRQRQGESNVIFDLAFCQHVFDCFLAYAV